MKHMLIIGLLIALTGCGATQRARIAKCESLGFQQGSTEFGNCMLQLRAEAESRRNAAATFSQPNPAAYYYSPNW